MFHTESYKLHEKSYKDCADQESINLYTDWFNKGTVDIWRHTRMLECLNSFLENDKGSNWLTIGDGRFGTSAQYIQNRNSFVTSTDIDVSLLEIAHKKGWINKYQYANAESLPFDDESFDYSFCKEAYHHFPRPYLAVYEMLRVSKKAIIFSEPADWLPSSMLRSILQNIKNKLKKILGIQVPHSDDGNFEPSGNYIYTISEREFQKIAMGLMIPAVAFRRFHDVYIAGVEKEKILESGNLFIKIKRKIKQNHLLTQLGLSSKNHIHAIIFKEIPPANVICQLKNLGFSIIMLPKNPYLK